MKLLNPHNHYVYNHTVVKLTGEYALNDHAKDQTSKVSYQITPVNSNDGSWTLWVTEHELSRKAKQKMKTPETDYHDQTYLDLVRYVMSNGTQSDDRTGTGTLSTFGPQMEFDISRTIPLLTTKKMFTKGIIHETLWYLKGISSVDYLQENGVNIWNQWADDTNSIGPIYGPNWREWPAHPLDQNKSIDQLQQAIDTINQDPNSRRIIISAWNPTFLPDPHSSPEENPPQGKGALAPCHAFIQFYCRNGYLSCKLTQRSADLFLGVPFNIAQYSILTYMVAHLTGTTPYKFIWSGGDVHIYTNHLDQFREQLTRTLVSSPTLHFNRTIPDIDSFTYDDFVIENYNPHPPIKASVSK